MEHIYVCDNFLSQDELKTATSVIQKSTWKFNHKSNGVEYFDTPFWSMDLSKVDFFSKHIKSAIEKCFGRSFDIVSVYANGQTYGQNGSYHVDNDLPGHYTFCLYLTDIEKRLVDTAGGYIYFNLNDKPYKICYEPLYNRGIFFPSNLLHKGCAFNRYIMDMRICVAFKLKERE